MKSLREIWQAIDEKIRPSVDLDKLRYIEGGKRITTYWDHGSGSGKVSAEMVDLDWKGADRWNLVHTASGNSRSFPLETTLQVGLTLEDGVKALRTTLTEFQQSSSAWIEKKSSPNLQLLASLSSVERTLQRQPRGQKQISGASPAVV